MEEIINIQIRLKSSETGDAVIAEILNLDLSTHGSDKVQALLLALECLQSTIEDDANAGLNLFSGEETLQSE